MTESRGEWISGIVLGIGLGLLFSHFLISRPAQVPPGSAAFATLSSRDALLDSQFPFGISSDVDAGLLDDLVAEEELQPPLPLRNALALEAAAESLQQTTNELAPIEPVAPAAEPEQLQIGEAAPLNGNSAADQQTIRGIIDIELSHLPADKREVWFEAMKDVNKEDVAGILRMWKLLGGPIPEAPMGGPSTTPFFSQHPDVPALATPDAQANWQRAQMERMIQVHANNVRYRNTPGYLPRIPYLLQPQHDTDRIGILLDFSRTRQVATGVPLDVAIRGAGFFLVQSEAGEKFYTRYGRFSLNADRQLSVVLADQTYLVQPIVQFPERRSDGEQIVIGPAGTVSYQAGEETSAAPQKIGQLQLVMPTQASTLDTPDGILFPLSDKDQGPHPILKPQTNANSSFIQGSLELPDISADEELSAISLLKSLEGP